MAKRVNFVVVDTLSQFIDGNENDPGMCWEFYEQKARPTPPR
ncbi:hypothetical protein [Mycobacterium sp.]|nr:hypothetical protein [Mycobacterium sp.]